MSRKKSETVAPELVGALSRLSQCADAVLMGDGSHEQGIALAQAARALETLIAPSSPQAIWMGVWRLLRVREDAARVAFTSAYDRMRENATVELIGRRAVELAQCAARLEEASHARAACEGR